MAYGRNYGDNTGAMVHTACAKHTAHLLHRMTHNHQPEAANWQPYGLKRRKRPATPALSSRAS